MTQRFAMLALGGCVQRAAGNLHNRLTAEECLVDPIQVGPVPQSQLFENLGVEAPSRSQSWAARFQVPGEVTRKVSAGRLCEANYYFLLVFHKAAIHAYAKRCGVERIAWQPQ